MSETWTSASPEWANGGFPKDVGDLWTRTQTLTSTGSLEPVFGEGTTWYFFDETWTDACGPFPSEADAQEAVQVYADNL